MSRIFSTVFFASVLSQALAVPMMASSGSQSYNADMSSYGSSSNSGSGYSSSGSKDAMNSGSWSGNSDSKGNTMMDDSTSTMMDDSSATANSAPQSTSYSSSSYSSSSSSPPMYGSGSSNWGGQGYNSCVQQCMAQYGTPSSMSTPPPSSNDLSSSMTDSSTPTSTSSGAATTHTVIVAPKLGVLRFVPAFLNASVGDTVRYMWGAGNHTVTESSILTPCNKSQTAGVFASGFQTAGFVFDKVINNTDTTFYYCGFPGHCEKGMFGILNPPSASASTSSNMTVGSWVMSQAQSDSSMSALYNYVMNQTMNTSAHGWGMDVDMSGMPQSSYGDVAQNAMYSALFYAANPGMLEKGQGASNVSTSGINVPTDISGIMANLAVANAAAAPSSTSSSGYGAAPAATAASANSNVVGQAAGAVANGSGRLASSSAVVAVVAIVASVFAL